MAADLTAETVRELLDYDPETGVFRWRVTRGGRAAAGMVAGSVESRGYRQIHINGRNYMAHRLAWLVVHGSWPAEEIDHLDRVRLNNRIGNLREATKCQNRRNSSGWAKSGFKGVSKVGDRWMARIKNNGREKYLGTFASPEEAHSAYASAAAELHGEFSCADARIVKRYGEAAELVVEVEEMA